METLGEATDYNGLHAILRSRADTIGLTREGIDHVAGLTRGHASKILAAVPMKNLGAVTLGPVLSARGVKLVVVEDEVALKRFAPLVESHRSKRLLGPRATIAPDVERRARELLHDRAVRAGRKGARVRLASQSPEERSRLASEAMKARWAKTPARERKRAIARLNAARKRKRKAPA